MLIVVGCGGGSEGGTKGGSESATASEGAAPSTEQSASAAKGKPEGGLTAQQRAHARVASLTLESPVAQRVAGSVEQLPATYTCDGKNDPPALRWRGIPAGTSELMLFAMNVQPVREKLFFDWTVAGLDPRLDGLEAGRLPSGAVVGRNGFGETGYSICPMGKAETYVFALYALPRKLSLRRGFDPQVARKDVLGLAGSTGLLAVSYARR